MDMSDDTDSDERYEIYKNDEEIVISDIEFFKMRKIGPQKNTDNVVKWSHERNKMDMINDQEFDERDQTGEKKDDLELEESENYERYQIENPELLRRVDSKH